MMGGGGGGARFRIFGGWGVAKGEGANFSPAITDRSPRPQSVPTFLTLKTDNIVKLRIELKSILLEIHSNKIKGTYI